MLNAADTRVQSHESLVFFSKRPTRNILIVRRSKSRVATQVYLSWLYRLFPRRWEKWKTPRPLGKKTGPILAHGACKYCGAYRPITALSCFKISGGTLELHLATLLITVQQCGECETGPVFKQRRNKSLRPYVQSTGVAATIDLFANIAAKSPLIAHSISPILTSSSV